MGNRRKRAVRVQFDSKLKLRFHGAKIRSGRIGVSACREGGSGGKGGGKVGGAPLDHMARLGTIAT